MSYTGMEDIFLTYYKLLDSVETSGSYAMSHVTDISFNDFVTARYLVDKKGYRSVSALTDIKMINYSGITPVRIDTSLSQTLRNMRSDIIISLGGTFRFQPLQEVMSAIYDSLSIGGRVILAAYPSVYDKDGRNMLEYMSSTSGVGVSAKLSRWYSSLYKSVSSLFVNSSMEDILADASSQEFASIFSSDCFYRYLFKDGTEHDKFFSTINDGESYTLSWKIIKGLKV